MKVIKDLLEINLSEDIKSVIDLEDQEENEIQSEIENYIVTNGIGNYLYKFCEVFTSNIKETGVWISGFYGSGKSYFGKMLGYILNNPKINGTSVIDRFIPRLQGIDNANLVENSLRKLDAINTRVIMTDIVKQHTNNGLAFTLFSKFLKSLGLWESQYGYMLFHLLIEGKYEDFKKHAVSEIGDDWYEQRLIAKSLRRVYTKYFDYSEIEYDQMYTLYQTEIENFDASKLKDELERYLKVMDETLVFMFDETSEAIAQKKINLTELEGLSESFFNSSLQRKVWTIAIAQEKLDDVINNSNISKSNLIKVTDRFKTKIDLKSTEVDVIIKEHLLKKNADSFSELHDYYRDHDGQISEATNLKSTVPTQTESAEEFSLYYPFHKYHFKHLQKFLFSSNALVANQIAARGMIMTTFDVLRKQVLNKGTFAFVTSDELCTEAQTAPPTELTLKYDNARNILNNAGYDVDGEKLLKTIHFLSESDITSRTVENITKTFMEKMDDYYKLKPKVQDALNTLVDAKLLIYAGNNYKITSSQEAKLLEEKAAFEVPPFIKKAELIKLLKTTGVFKQVSGIMEENVAFNFLVVSDMDDEIVPSTNKHLKFVIYNMYNITEDPETFVENVKMHTQHDKNTITFVPNVSRFEQIDRLIEEVRKLSHMDEKYGTDPDQSVRRIIGDFAIMKEENEKLLSDLVREVYTKGTLVYMFDDQLIDEKNFKPDITATQQKVVKNIYTKRLNRQLSEKVGVQVLKEKYPDRLHKLFDTNDFKFFDSNGNFIGEHLKVIEEISKIIQSRFIDGSSLEEEFSVPPWGYGYGTVNTTLAVLLRAGRLVVKHEGFDHFDHKDEKMIEVFENSRKFKAASFKSVTKSLSSTQKNQIVQALLDLDYKRITGKHIDWNANDFEVSDAVKILADHYLGSLDALNKTVSDFEILFASAYNQKSMLQEYTSRTTENNYIEKAENFLSTKDHYIEGINLIKNAEKFIAKNLEKLKTYKRFIDNVELELTKAGISDEIIKSSTASFRKLYDEGVVQHFSELQKEAQVVKDEYYKRMENANKFMNSKYDALKSEVVIAKEELVKYYPPELNVSAKSKLENLENYCEDRIHDRVKLEFDVACQLSKFTLSEMMNNNELASNKQSELSLVQGEFVKEKKEEKQDDKKEKKEKDKQKEPRKIQLKISHKVMKAKDYRQLLSDQIRNLAGVDNDDEVEVDVVNE